MHKLVDKVEQVVHDGTAVAQDVLHIGNGSPAILYGWTCPRCGAWVSNNVFHACYNNAPPLALQQGWQCPVCKQVYAPWIATCRNCVPR